MGSSSVPAGKAGSTRQIYPCNTTFTVLQSKRHCVKKRSSGGDHENVRTRNLVKRWCGLCPRPLAGHGHLSTPNRKRSMPRWIVSSSRTCRSGARGRWCWTRGSGNIAATRTGEQLWWAGLLLLGFGATSGGALGGLQQWWFIAFGVAFNHSIDTFKTLQLIGNRMLNRRIRNVSLNSGAHVAAYQEFHATTPLLLPVAVRGPPAAAAAAALAVVWQLATQASNHS